MGHVELLRRNKSFRLLFLATLGSLLGTWLATIALTVDVYDRTRSGGWVGALLISLFLPTVVVGLLLGPLLDRLRRRSLMIASDLVRAGVFCALPFVDEPAAIVALGAVTGLANGLFRPAVNAGLPNLVAERDLEKGNALFQTVENFAWALGPLLGGTVVALSGTDVAYWINAGSFVFSAAVLSLIAPRLLQSETALSRGHLRDLADGFRLVRTSRALRTVILAWSVAMVGSGFVDVGEIVLAKDAFGAGDFGFGLLFGAGGFGLALGSLLGGALAERRSIGVLYAPAILLMALGYGAGAISPNVWVASAAVVFAGLGNGAASLFNVLFIQRDVADHLRGRAFTVAMSTTYAVLGPAMAVAGPLTTRFGARWIWGIGATAYAVAAAVALVLAPRVRTEPVPPGERGIVSERPAVTAHGAVSGEEPL